MRAREVCWVGKRAPHRVRTLHQEIVEYQTHWSSPLGGKGKTPSLATRITRSAPSFQHNSTALRLSMALASDFPRPTAAWGRRVRLDGEEPGKLLIRHCDRHCRHSTFASPSTQVTAKRRLRRSPHRPGTWVALVRGH